MKKKIIIFDLDGVIFDSIELVKEYTKRQYVGLTDEMQKELLTGNIFEEIQKITAIKKEETEEEKLTRKLEYTKNKLAVPMYPGMKELLAELYESGYTLVLNTSAVERNCLPLLEQANITHLFDLITTAEISKSKVAKFKLIKEKYSADNDKMLFITDTLGDIREADIAGIPSIGVTWGAHDKSYFDREPHSNLIGIVNSIEELKVFIKDQ